MKGAYITYKTSGLIICPFCFS